MQMFSQVQAAGLDTVLLVDGENIPPSLAAQITLKSDPNGRAAVRRVYGDVTLLPAWKATAGFEMVHTGRAKNAADIRMVIDALDLAHRGNVGRVIVVSSDRDFTHLAQYLRARGIIVIGMGEAKTHSSFRAACSQFEELGEVETPAPKAVAVPTAIFVPTAPAVPMLAGAPKVTAVPTAKPQTLDTPAKQIAALIKAWGKDGLMITDLSLQMRTLHGFLISEQEQNTWRAYLGAHPALYDLDPKGTHAKVRLK